VSQCVTSKASSYLSDGIFQVVEKLGLSSHNIRGLHQVVDSVPARAEWKTQELWFKSDSDAKHIVHYRDPCDAVKSLLGNPTHAKDIVYRPRKIFTDSSRTCRIYNEMWTGDWWHTVQVSNHSFCRRAHDAL